MTATPAFQVYRDWELCIYRRGINGEFAGHAIKSHDLIEVGRIGGKCAKRLVEQRLKEYIDARTEKANDNNS